MLTSLTTFVKEIENNLKKEGKEEDYAYSSGSKLNQIKFDYLERLSRKV